MVLVGWHDDDNDDCSSPHKKWQATINQHTIKQITCWLTQINIMCQQQIEYTWLCITVTSISMNKPTSLSQQELQKQALYLSHCNIPFTKTSTSISMLQKELLKQFIMNFDDVIHSHKEPDKYHPTTFHYLSR